MSGERALELSLRVHYPPEIVSQVAAQSGDRGQVEFDDLGATGHSPTADLEQILQQRGYPTPQHFLAGVRRNLFTDVAFVEQTSLLAVRGGLRHYQFAAVNVSYGVVAESLLNLGLVALFRRPIRGAVADLGVTTLAVGAAVFLLWKFFSYGPQEPLLIGIGRQRPEIGPKMITEDFLTEKGEEQLNDVLTPEFREAIHGAKDKSGPVTFKDSERYEVEVGRSGEFRVKKDRKTVVVEHRDKGLAGLTEIAAGRLAERLNYPPQLWQLFMQWPVTVYPSRDTGYAARLQGDLEREGACSLRTYGVLPVGGFMMIRGMVNGFKWMMSRSGMGPMAGWFAVAQCLAGLLGAGASLASVSRYNRGRRATDESVVASPTQLWGFSLL